MKRTIFEPEHEMFRESVRALIEKEVTPHHAQWEKDGMVSRAVWQKAGDMGFLCLDAPEEYGGAGIHDFRYNPIFSEEQCIMALNAHALTPADAAMAKWWTTDLQKRVTDRCLQLFGGYGYMTEYPISKFYLDARVQSIYAGTNEIMKEVVGRSLGV